MHPTEQQKQLFKDLISKTNLPFNEIQNIKNAFSRLNAMELEQCIYFLKRNQ